MDTPTALRMLGLADAYLAAARTMRRAAFTPAFLDAHAVYDRAQMEARAAGLWLFEYDTPATALEQIAEVVAFEAVRAALAVRRTLALAA